MSTGRMADSDRAFEPQLFGNRRQIIPEIGPVAGWVGLTAATMAPEFNCQRMSVWKCADGLVPDAAVEASSMDEEQGRVFPRPIPHCKIDIPRPDGEKLGRISAA